MGRRLEWYHYLSAFALISMVVVLCYESNKAECIDEGTSGNVAELTIESSYEPSDVEGVDLSNPTPAPIMWRAITAEERERLDALMFSPMVDYCDEGGVDYFLYWPARGGGSRLSILDDRETLLGVGALSRPWTIPRDGLTIYLRRGDGVL